MSIVIECANKLRCDMLVYGAVNLSGKRKACRVFPTSRKGTLVPTDIHSMVIRGPLGLQVVLTTTLADDWEAKPWRAIRLEKDTAVPPEKAALYGARLPDLDLYAEPHLKRIPYGIEESYPQVATLAEGTGWTFGRWQPDGLKGKVVRILLERR